MDLEDVLERFDVSTPAILIPISALLGALAVHWAAKRYHRICLRYGATPTGCGLAARFVAKRLLTRCGLEGIPVRSGAKSNCYHPRRQEIRLKQTTFDSPSLSAFSTAAHEVGHAQQFAENILLCRLRQLFWPICWVMLAACVAVALLSVIGILEISSPRFFVSLLIISLVVAGLQLPINLPLERDASRRRELVRQANLLSRSEQQDFDRILNAAWKTHAAVETQRWIVVMFIALATVGMVWFAELEPYALDALTVFPDANPNQLAIPQGHVDYIEPPRPIVMKLIAWCAFVAPFGIIAFVVIQYYRGKALRTRAQAVELNNSGMALSQQGKFADAIERFTQATSLDPTMTIAFFNRGCTHVSLGQFEQALSDYEAAHRLAPNFVNAIAGRGYVRLLRDEAELAWADVNQALRQFPQCVMALHCRGELHLARDDYDRAIDDFTAVLQLEPAHSDALRDRGLSWYCQGNYDRAIADLDEALRLNPSDAVARNNRGAAHLKKGEYEPARTDLQKSINQSSKFANPYKHLAWLQATCPLPEFRDGKKAVANATRALELVQWKAIEWFETLGAAHAEAGDFAEAVKWQERCLKESPDDRGSRIQEALEQFQAKKPMRQKIAEPKASEPACR